MSVDSLETFQKQVDRLLVRAQQYYEENQKLHEELHNLKKDLSSKGKNDSVSRLEAENKKLRQDQHLVLLKLKEMLSQVEELEKRM